MRAHLALCMLLGVGCSGSSLTPGDFGALDENAVTFSTETFVVHANEEVYKCQDFKNPFGGVDTEVQKFESHMAPGSHHMLLFFGDNAVDSSLVDCPALQFGPLPYGSQRPDSEVAFPDGIATIVKGTEGFHLQMHYLNASPNDIMAQVTIILHKAKPGSTNQHAGVFFFNNISGIDVAPSTTATVTATCQVPSDINILYGTGHIHLNAQSITVTADNTEIYTTDSWNNSPFKLYDPPVALKAGTEVTWSCALKNDDPVNPLTFGESARTNAMCIFSGQYYPVPDGADPTINCVR